MAIIGIDLGTTNTLACVFLDGKASLIPNEEGGYFTKSAVSLLEDGTVLTGRRAKERLPTHPDRTAASYKVHMGTEWPDTLGEQSFRPEELSALVLKQIKREAEVFLGEAVEEAVISVPAYFNDNQRCATKLAAELAGLKVSRLINEPSAAAVYYRWQNADDADGKLMIIDFGGGTLDVSIVDCFDNIIEIVAIAGDNHLGGNDIDKAIAGYFCRENNLSVNMLSGEERAELMQQAESAKIALSAPDTDGVLMRLRTEAGEYQLSIDKTLLAQICEPVFKRVEKVLRRALENREAAFGIRKVVLVGGSSRLPVFHEFLEKLMSARPVVAAEPDRIVALGAGVCAGIKERREELQDIVMTDVCPFSLGVATYNSRFDRDPHMAVLIQRSSMLPVSRSDRFYTLSDRQEALRFEIYQGEDYYVSGNLKLGEIQVRVPYGAAGSQWAEVTFTYDIDGILHVEVKASGGDRKETIILNPKLHLSERELKEAMERIAQIKQATGTDVDSSLFEQALSLYEQLDGARRSSISAAIEYYCMARDSDDIYIFRMARERLKKLTEQFTKELEENPFEQLYGLGISEETEKQSADKESAEIGKAE